MELFNTANYEDSFSKLIVPDKLNDLGPGKAEMKHLDQLGNLGIPQSFSPHQVQNHDYAKACISALWLHHDFLDQSHTISQSILNTTGSYWHGIMHRREGDYWNSKYWFRRVGEHPIFKTLHNGVVQLCSDKNSDETCGLANRSSWDPNLFIDLIEEAYNSGSETEHLYQKVQQLEWQLLFDYSYVMAKSQSE